MLPPSLQTFTISQSYVWDNYAPSSFHNYTKDTSQITKNFGKAWFTIPENITIAKTKSEESADNSNKDSNNENSYSKNNLNQKWKASQNIYYFCK